MNQSLTGVCGVLAATLATECSAHASGDMTTFILVNPVTNEKCVVMVATTEQGSDRLLEWRDHEITEGLMVNNYHTELPKP